MSVSANTNNWPANTNKQQSAPGTQLDLSHIRVGGYSDLNVNVDSVDFESVQRSFDLAEQAVSNIQQATSRQFESAIGAVKETSAGAVKTIEEAQPSEMLKTVALYGLAALVVVKVLGK